MQGFLNLNKPPGMTSHDCVARVRRLLQMKRVGHGGTLDPLATGVLPIALGPATRLLPYLPTEKTYQATIRFGLQTTTEDLAGEAIAQTACPTLSFEQVQASLPGFLGQIQQVPPMYSAIQVQGQRLYNLARRGEVVDVPARTVDIRALNVLDWRSGDYPELDLQVVCGPGTYIRSLARDLGQAVQTGATLVTLTRTASCGLSLVRSLTLDGVATQSGQGTFQPVSPGEALAHLPRLTLPEVLAQRWCWGQKLTYQELNPVMAGVDPMAAGPDSNQSATTVQITNTMGECLGVGLLTATELVPKVVLLPEAHEL